MTKPTASKSKAKAVTKAVTTRPSPKPVDAPDAITLLKADHRLVEDLFGKFKDAKTSKQKERLASDICLELTVHTIIEEEIFYPACQKAGVEDDLMDESYVEHDGAKLLIAELSAGKAGDRFYDAKLQVLSEDIKHHVKEEERFLTGMFAQAKRKDLDLDALGAEMFNRKQQLKSEFKKTGLPAPETRTLSGAKMKYGKPISDKSKKAA